MPINRSIEDLPRSHPSTGNPPASNRFVVEKLADKFLADYLEREGAGYALAIPEAGPYRASYASTRCDRALWYKLNGVEVSNAMTVADAWRFGLGQIVHDQIQPIIDELFEGKSEVDVDLRVIGLPGSAHADTIMVYDGHPTLVEYKTIGGFQFKMMATTFKGKPQGPRFGAVLQAAMVAKAAGVERIVIAYLALENMSPGMGQSFDNGSDAGRFCAEWHYTVAELDQQIEFEVERVADVLAQPVAPPRRIHDPEYPVGAEIRSPLKDRAPWVVAEEGVVLDSGTTWFCGYCDFRDKCIADG